MRSSMVSTIARPAGAVILFPLVPAAGLTYDDTVKLLRFLAVIVYTSYLLNVGLLLLIVPWSEAWSLLILQFPAPLAFQLDAPAVRGLISGFGLLHLLMVVSELLFPPKPRS